MAKKKRGKGEKGETSAGVTAEDNNDAVPAEVTPEGSPVEASSTEGAKRLIIDDKGDFHPDFKQIFLDIVKGVQYMHLMIGVVHGELLPNNIYIKKSVINKEETFLTDSKCFASSYRAKLGNPVPEGFETDPKSDYRSIRKMLRDMVTTEIVAQLSKSSTMDYDGFSLLLNNLTPSDLGILHLHPFLLNCVQRCALRHIGYQNVIFYDAYEKVVGDIRSQVKANPNLNFLDWKQKITNPRLQKLDGYNSHNSDAIAFIKFSRNALVHGNETYHMEVELTRLTVKEMDSILSAAWPSMMSLWFNSIKKNLGTHVIITMPGSWFCTYQM